MLSGLLLAGCDDGSQGAAAPGPNADSASTPGPSTPGPVANTNAPPAASTQPPAPAAPGQQASAQPSQDAGQSDTADAAAVATGLSNDPSAPTNTPLCGIAAQQSSAIAQQLLPRQYAEAGQCSSFACYDAATATYIGADGYRHVCR